MKTKLATVLKAFVLSLLMSISASADTAITLYPSQDMWLGTYYDTVSQNGSYIKIGGWGDRYIGCWQFNVATIPVGATVTSAILYMPPHPTMNTGFIKVSSAAFWQLATSWNEINTPASSLMGYNLGTAPLDPTNGLTADIKSLVVYWRTSPNYGFALVPNQNNNNYYFFPSRESGITPRPRVVVGYVPKPALKLPLPGNKSWLVTTQAGGIPTHQYVEFYAIDFDDIYRVGTGNPVSVPSTKYDVPVLAAAGGIVVACQYDGIYGAGNYIKIDHDGDSSVSTGYQTIYMHMKNTKNGTYSQSPFLAVGSRIGVGQVLGFVGTTTFANQSVGSHVHFEVRYQDLGSSQATVGDSKELNSVLLEGIPITSYKVKQYYYSSNRDVLINKVAK